MVSIQDLSSLPAQEHVIERLGLAGGAFGLLCATGNSGKTMLIQYLACCISSGSPLFKQYPVKKGSVIHIDMEQSKIQTQRRYIRLAAGLGLKSLDVARVVLRARFDAPDAILEDVRAELVALFKGKTLAIIDSLKAVSATDENTAEIEVLLKLFKSVAEETGCAILLVHHKGKGKDAKQSGRGHSSIYDSVDVQIDLESSNEVYTLSCAKNRDGRFFDGIRYQLLDSGAFNQSQKCSERLEFDLLQGDVKTKKSTQRERIVEVLTSSKETSIKNTSLFDAVRGDRHTFREALDSLISSQEITEEKGARGALLYSITEKGKANAAWTVSL